MNKFDHSLAIYLAAVSSFLCAGYLSAQTVAPHPIDPHPYPKPALASDDITAVDYMTVLLSPSLQAALKVTTRQSAIFAAMQARYDFNFRNVVGMGSTATMNVARMKYVLGLTGAQVRDQLTIEEDKQFQDYFTKKILTPITVESETSDTPLQGPHLVSIPGFGQHYVQGSVLHYGSITVHYTKFSTTAAATQTQTPSPQAPIVSAQPVSVDDLPPLDDSETRMRQRRQQFMNRSVTNGTAPPQNLMPQPVPPSPKPISPTAPSSTVRGKSAPGEPPPSALRARPTPSFVRPLETAPLRVAPAIPPDAPAVASTDKLTDSLLKTLSHEFDANSFVATRAVGGGFADQGAMDMPGKPGVLIGFDVGVDDFMQSQTVQSITPIYLTAAGEVHGHFYGKRCLNTVTIKAKEGYAVGGMTVRGGAGLDALSVQFMKRTAIELDPHDTYPSEVAGGDLGEHGEDVNGKGVPVVGVSVKVGDRGFLGLGLIFAAPVN